MAMKLKEGVSYDKKTGTVTIAPGVQGVSDATRNAVSGTGTAGTIIKNATSAESKVNALATTGGAKSVLPYSQTTNGKANAPVSSTTTGTQTGATTTGTQTSTTNADGTPKSTTPEGPTSTEGPKVVDDTPGILTFDELSPDMQTYLNDNPAARAEFDATGKQGVDNQKRWLTDADRARTNMQLSDTYQKDQANIDQQSRDIKEQQGIRQAQDAINKEKSNQLYSSASDVSSYAKNTAAAGKLDEMAKQLDEFIQLNNLQDNATAKMVVENTRRLKEQLAQNIGYVMADKITAIDNGLKSGEIATEEQLQKIFKENSAAILKEIPALSDYAAKQMSDLTQSFMSTQQGLIKAQDEWNKNANTYNEDMSKAKGYAVDGNGQPVLDVNGEVIPILPDPLYPPKINEETGTMTQIIRDENGVISAIETKISGWQKPASVNEAKDIIQVDTIDPETGETIKRPFNVKTNQWVALPGMSAPSGVPDNTTGTLSAPFIPPQGFGSRALSQSIPVTQTGDGIQIGIASGVQLGECGTLANDYGSQIEGFKRVDDSWASKKANVNSKEPVAGGLVMWNLGSQFEKWGHIGIVEKVNADGSFQIFDTNYVGKGTSSRRTITQGSPEWNKIQSDGGFFSPGQNGQSGAKETGVNGALNLPISYERRIKQMVPTSLMNSEVELDQLNQTIKKMYKGGLSAEDATLTYLGFSVDNPQNKKTAMDLVQKVRGTGLDVPNNFFSILSDYVNSGNPKEATNYTNRVIDTALSKTIPSDQFVSTPNLDFNKSVLTRLNSFIEKNSDKIGPLKGRWADLQKKFAGDADYQALSTLLAGSNAEVRRAFGGTAVTDSEMKALRDFIGNDTKVPIENLMTALQTNFDTYQSRYDAQRNFYVGGYEPADASMQNTAGGQSTGTEQYADFSSI